MSQIDTKLFPSCEKNIFLLYNKLVIRPAQSLSNEKIKNQPI